MTPGEKSHLRIAGACGLILLFCRLASATYDSVSLLGFQTPALCAFRMITGLDCPGCGLTRSLILAVHGSLYESYLRHVWGIPLLMILLIQIPYRGSLLLLSRDSLFKVPTPLKRWISHFVFLSLLLPWVAKTISLLVVRCC